MNEKQIAWELVVNSIKNYTMKYGSIRVDDALADEQMYISEKADFADVGFIEL